MALGATGAARLRSAADVAPRVSRRLFGVFFAVMLLVSGQLAWWMTFNIGNANRNCAAQLQRLQSEVLWARHMVALAAQAGTPQPPEALLAEHFANLEWVARPPHDRALAAAYGDHDVQVRAAVVAGLQRRRAALVRMFVSEGVFFWLLVALGAALIVRTLRHEGALLRQQNNFVSAVTHELKSPLASIRLHTETMQLRDPPAATRARYLRFMRGDIDRLETLVGNLLAVARLDAGRFIVHPQRCDLAAAVQRCVADLRSAQGSLQAAAEGEAPQVRQIEVSGAEAPVWVRCDPAVLTTVLRNLLDNASKYGGGHIAMAVAQAAGQAQVRVADRGLGLAPAEVDKIFHKFYRVGDELVRQTEGSGLGLYLVKTLLQQSGGSIVAHSDGPGLGTCFVASLPLHNEAA